MESNEHPLLNSQNALMEIQDLEYPDLDAAFIATPASTPSNSLTSLQSAVTTGILVSQENSSNLLNVYEFSLDQQLDSEFEILCHFHFKNFGLIVRFALSLVITCFVRV